MSSNSLRLIIHFSSLSTFVFFPFLLFAQSPQGSERSIDELAEKALKAWKAPGFALVIVKMTKFCISRATACALSAKMIP